MTRFIALQDFEDEATGTNYCRGLGYIIRPGNHRLAVKVEAWCREGKVRMAAPGGGTITTIIGHGVVK